MSSSIIEDARYSDIINGFAPHAHNCYEIIYLCEGTLSMRISGMEYTVNAPSLIFISKLEQHSIKVIGSVYKRYYLCISPLLAGSYVRDYTLLTLLSNRREGFCHVLSASAFKADADRIFLRLTEEFASEKPYSLLRQTSLLTELLILIYRTAPNLFAQENNKSISMIWQIQCTLEENCKEHFTLAELAEKYHMSPCYLAHLFKKVTGYSVMQYLTMCRLSLARQLLSETDMSVTEIVYNSGFSDSSNFSRLFKREMNISPIEYRKKVQQ